ncbi:MAG TPA: MerR family transcriptional regulator [Devosiaceae bacterium]|nr:MerR family transcriptional regulator [Devosiaceae bacterium]
MLISEFAQTTGLSRDTVRFYVRLGLLLPESNGKGGRNPYQSFTAAHVRAARIIRVAQSLGLPLKDIAAIGAERRAGRMTRERSIAVLAGQLEVLEAKGEELAAMTAYLRAKIEWLAGGEAGPPPDFEK